MQCWMLKDLKNEVKVDHTEKGKPTAGGRSCYAYKYNVFININGFEPIACSYSIQFSGSRRYKGSDKIYIYNVIRKLLTVRMRNFHPDSMKLDKDISITTQLYKIHLT